MDARTHAVADPGCGGAVAAPSPLAAPPASPLPAAAGSAAASAARLRYAVVCSNAAYRSACSGARSTTTSCAPATDIGTNSTQIARARAVNAAPESCAAGAPARRPPSCGAAQTGAPARARRAPPRLPPRLLPRTRRAAGHARSACASPARRRASRPGSRASKSRRAPTTPRRCSRQACRSARADGPRAGAWPRYLPSTAPRESSGPHQGPRT